jgi:hypothetical protein
LLRAPLSAKLNLHLNIFLQSGDIMFERLFLCGDEAAALAALDTFAFVIREANLQAFALGRRAGNQ